MDSQPGTGSHPAKATELAMLCHLMFGGSPLPMVAVAGAQHIVRYVNPDACRLAGKNKDVLI